MTDSEGLVLVQLSIVNAADMQDRTPKVKRDQRAAIRYWLWKCGQAEKRERAR
jgi:hypothetical protein